MKHTYRSLAETSLDLRKEVAASHPAAPDSCRLNKRQLECDLDLRSN